MCREIISLDKDWKFHKGDTNNGQYKGLDDSNWESVNVPHDWSVKYEFSKDNSSGTGYVCGGKAWYRTNFNLIPLENKKVYITFEGVYNNSQVWINSNYLGKRPFGYSTFTYDITDFISEDGNNQVSVKVNHDYLADSRWFTGSGIVRPVYITITNETAIDEYGVFVKTITATKESATVQIDTKHSGDENAEVNHTIFDENNNEIANSNSSDIEINSPNLWSPENPYLYTLKTRLVNENSIVDEVYTIFGIRTFSFDCNKGFFLNDENIKFKGVCLHHDAGCLGAAVPKDVWRRRLLKLKEVNCNAIRTSHNPPDVTLLELCDELGFLVIDEAFDEWEGPKNKWWQGHNIYPPKLSGYYEDFPTWAEKDIKTMVLRDRNHPSVIMWSIGNEVDYPNDPYVHPLFDKMTGNNDADKPAAEREYDSNKPNANRLATIAKILSKYVKECDTTRPVTAALAYPELSNKIGYMQALDVVGYNYKEHLYSENHREYPNAIFYGSENNHNPINWKAVTDNQYISGQFLWTGFDYMGEARGWPIRIADPGLFDTASFPKHQFYLRKALWTDEPFVKLMTKKKDDEERFTTDKWQYTKDDMIDIICYTNQEEATLYLNNKEISTKKQDNNSGSILWTIPYDEGELKIVSINNISDIINTAKELKTIQLITDKDKLNRNEICHIEIYIKDENNVTVTRDEKLKITVENAKLLGLENGKIDDISSYNSNTRSTFNGKLLAYICKGDSKGTATISVTNKTLASTIQIEIL